MLQAAFNLVHIGVAIGPIVSVFYLSSLLLLNGTRVGARLLQPLQAYGRMALSNYIGQTVLLLAIQSIFLKTDTTTYVVSTLVSLGIVAVQIIASNLSDAAISIWTVGMVVEMRDLLEYCADKKGEELT
ncbi:hypothetical protein D3C81_1380470 [compost metagenome]